LTHHNGGALCLRRETPIKAQRMKRYNCVLAKESQHLKCGSSCDGSDISLAKFKTLFSFQI
jgi:hypothetical protein